MRILIADDNPHLRRVLRRVLEAHEGWTVCAEAQDGLDAVEQAKQCKPDLVLLDLAMPHMSGLAAARRICELLPSVPILMHTLYDSPQLQSEAKKSGVQQVIPKSDGHTLIATIEALAQTIGPPQTAPADTLPPPMIMIEQSKAADPAPSTETPASKENASGSESSTPKQSAA